jgi:hypothetical protein
MGGNPVRDDCIAPEEEPRSPAHEIKDSDWNYWSNPPHMFAIPTGNVGIGGVPPTDSKLYVLSETMAWQYGLNVTSGLGIKSVSTAWEGTGIYGEGGHIGVAGSGYIGLYGQGFHGGWFEGNGYFSGNLGIGNLSYDSRLHVEGDIYCNGSLIGGSHNHSDLYYTKSEIDALLDGFNVINIEDKFGQTTNGIDGSVTISYDTPFPDTNYYIFVRPTLIADFDPGSGNIPAGTVVDACDIIKTTTDFTAFIRYGGEDLKGADVDIFYIAIEQGTSGIGGGCKVLTGSVHDRTDTPTGWVDIYYNDNHTNEFDTPPTIFVDVVDPSNGNSLHGEVISVGLDAFRIRVWTSIGGSLVLNEYVDIRWLAIETGVPTSSSQTDIVTGVKPYNAAIFYYADTGFIIDVSSDIPSGFTLIDVTAKGRKTNLAGALEEEPPLNLYPKVNGINIEILVWDVFGVEYDDWTNQRAHIEYTLFMKNPESE